MRTEKNFTGRWSALRFMLTMATIMAMAMVLAGCTARETRMPRVLIPEEDTPRDQFLVAEQQAREARGIFDERVRRDELRKAIAAYQAVEDRFPNDERYTPASSVLIAEIYRDIEDHERARRQFEHVLQRYPNDRDVHISALLGLGETLDALGRPIEAQRYYKMLMDQYGTSTDPRIRQIVEQARIRYRQIRLIEG